MVRLDGLVSWEDVWCRGGRIRRVSETVTLEKGSLWDFRMSVSTRCTGRTEGWVVWDGDRDGVDENDRITGGIDVSWDDGGVGGAADGGKVNCGVGAGVVLVRSVDWRVVCGMVGERGAGDCELVSVGVRVGGTD